MRLAFRDLLYSRDRTHYVGTPGEPAFSGAWVNSGAGFIAMHFYKTASGEVVITGTVRTGASGSSVFTLPVGYRPSSLLLTAGLVGEGQLGYATIASTGTVVFTGPNTNDCFIFAMFRPEA